MRNDGTATYAIVDASDGGIAVEHRHVAYDHAALVAQLAELRHPSPGFIEGYDFRPDLTGGTTPAAAEP